MRILKTKWYLTRWNNPKSEIWKKHRIMFNVWINQPFETKRAAIEFCEREISDSKPMNGREILKLSSNLYRLDSL